jgi:hypothetical protein
MNPDRPAGTALTRQIHCISIQATIVRGTKGRSEGVID